MKYISIIFSIALLFISCKGDKNQVKSGNDNQNELQDSTYIVQYAQGFTVDLYPDFKVVTVKNPWDTTKILQKYILVDKSIDLPQDLPEGVVIRTPLSEVVAYSTIHSSTLAELHKETTIKGVCEPEYISVPYVQEGIKSGKIQNLGQASNPDVEKIIDLEPEAILATPIDGQSYGNVQKIGIPILETPDYMEPTALGRAEWIRFYSLFYDNGSYADSLFQVTVNNYNQIIEKIASVSTRPTVFNDLMYRGVWYISGGDSFISKMYQDAGAEYVWANNGKNSFTTYAFENVLNDAGEADFWLIKYNKPTDLTYKTLEEEYKPYSYFKAFKDKNIYGCNTNYRKYYEDLPIHPDYILQDLAFIFHPDLFPHHTLKYYTKMKD